MAENNRPDVCEYSGAYNGPAAMPAYPPAGYPMPAYGQPPYGQPGPGYGYGYPSYPQGAQLMPPQQPAMDPNSSLIGVLMSLMISAPQLRATSTALQNAISALEGLPDPSLLAPI